MNMALVADMGLNLTHSLFLSGRSDLHYYIILLRCHHNTGNHLLNSYSCMLSEDLMYLIDGWNNEIELGERLEMQYLLK